MSDKLLEDCKEYVNELNNGVPNGLGQHMVRGVRSDIFLSRMYRDHGKGNVNSQLRDLFNIKQE